MSENTAEPSAPRGEMVHRGTAIKAVRSWRAALPLAGGVVASIVVGAAVGTVLWYLTASDQAQPKPEAPSHAVEEGEPAPRVATGPAPAGPPVDPHPEVMVRARPATGEARQDWMEEPPIAEDRIAALIDRQGAPGEGAAPPAEAEPLPKEVFRKPSAREIDSALARLDLAAFTPANVAPGAPPAWQRHAVAGGAPAADGPVIALVIDDLGLNRPNTRRTIALPGPLTLAFLTYAKGLPAFAEAARRAGHELMVHVPMAPLDPRYDPGPNALDAGFDRKELARRLDWAFSRFDGYVGISNHMGSGFTTSVPGMAQVMMELRARGLLYFDSLTVPATVGAAVADRLGVPFAKRDVFIDNDPDDRDSIRRQLAQLERIALKTGRAIGIAHPHDATIEELAAWLPAVQARGIRLVPISAVVHQPSGVAVTAPRADGPS